MSRTTASYASAPLRQPTEEERARLQPVQDVFTDDGVWAGRLVWRGELDAWCGRDTAHNLPLRRGTFEAAKTLILRRVACSTRQEAKDIR